MPESTGYLYEYELFLCLGRLFPRPWYRWHTALARRRAECVVCGITSPRLTCLPGRKASRDRFVSCRITKRAKASKEAKDAKERPKSPRSPANARKPIRAASMWQSRASVNKTSKADIGTSGKMGALSRKNKSNFGEYRSLRTIPVAGDVTCAQGLQWVTLWMKSPHPTQRVRLQL